jgi:hypothetical protein
MDAQYIWFKDEDKSRDPYAAFRKCLTVCDTGNITKAVFHIFADTVYALHVNGSFVGFGPVRFDPRYPQYDTYDIGPYLKKGNNVIAVLANFHGHKVFKSIPEQGAMIAWGEVDEGGTITDLRTDASWKCMQHTAYDRYTPKLSFALDARIHYDQGRFDESWIQPDYKDSHWPGAVPLRNQKAFGPLTPREIPFMELTPVVPEKIHLWPHIRTERLYSFYLELPFNYATAFDPQEGYSKFMAWNTYIYSPCKQAVTSACLYEKVWVNGISCEPKMEDPYRPLRYNMILELNEGWNYIFGQVEINQDIYECYLALPEGRGLVLSVEKNMNSKRWFRHTQIFPMERDGELRALTLPWAEDFCTEAIGGWVTAANGADSPCREASWDIYGPAAQAVTPESVNGASDSFIVRKDLHPDGFTLVFDMSHMRLLIPHIKLQGVKGAAVDLLYGDRYTEDGQHLRSLSWVPLGDRVQCGDDILSWFPIQPRGFRYLNITIRNAACDVRIDGITFQSAQYPVNKIGSFECSDSLLNQIWEMGVLTLSINMEDAYDDCVDRERGLYALDMLIQYHVNLACFGDQALMKRNLELYGQSSHETGLFRCLYPNTGHYIIPDFCLHIVDSFYRYYLYTGDTALMSEYWPAIMANLLPFHRLSDERSDGLLRGERPAGDWPRHPVDNLTGFYGDGDRTENEGINGIFSCFYLFVLRGAAEMAKALSTDELGDLQQRITKLEKSIPDAFWNEEKGLYADNTDHERFSPHASLYALHAGVTTPEQLVRLRKNIPPLLTPFFTNGYDSSDGFVFQTCYAYHMLNALYKLGLSETAEQCMRDGWRFFINKGLVTTSEHFDLSSSNCHAWAASPTYILSRYALGVYFDAGSDSGDVIIQIHPGTLTWAKGRYPHPLGAVEVAWHKENGKVIVDHVSVPEGVSYTIREGAEVR